MLKVKWDRVIYCDILNTGVIVRWIDLANGTMFRITAFFSDTLKGHPREGLYIGIDRIGSYLFPISDHYKTGYVAEKLNIPDADAAPLADWMNAQMKNDVPQQGVYKKSYILDIEPVVYAGERPYLPLCAVIIDEEK